MVCATTLCFSYALLPIHRTFTFPDTRGAGKTGTVFTNGMNATGQLGIHPDHTERKKPTQVKGDLVGLNIVKIAAVSPNPQRSQFCTLSLLCVLVSQKRLRRNNFDFAIRIILNIGWYAHRGGHRCR